MSAPKLYPSKAPPPIKPLSGLGGGAGAAVCRKPATAPDWAFWPASRPVAPWQAVALSLNLDPDSLKHSPLAYMAAPNPVLESVGFPDAEIEAAFRKRLALLAAFVSHASRKPLGELAGMLVAHTLPPKLAAMATAPAATASPKTGAAMATHVAQNESATDKRSKWEIPGRLEHEAREIGEQWMNKQSKKPGVNAIAKHVEGELKNRNRTGPRGDYWDWETIKKEALTGITGRKANGKE